MSGTERAIPEPPSAGLDTARRRELMQRSRSALMTYVGVGSVLIFFTLWLAATEPTFATYDNFINILNTNAVLLVAAIGLTLVLLVGGFDLSIGGVLALSGSALRKAHLDGRARGSGDRARRRGRCAAGRPRQRNGDRQVGPLVLRRHPRNRVRVRRRGAPDHER